MNKKIVLTVALVTTLIVGIASVSFALADATPTDARPSPAIEEPRATPMRVAETDVRHDPAVDPLPVPPISIDPRYPPISIDPLAGQPPVSIDPILGQPAGELMEREIVAAKPIQLDHPVEGISPPPAS